MSEVTICNLALSHIGDTATVMSIKPPDSSVQAQLCARFYYVARNAVLEMAAWGFATRRVKLAELWGPHCNWDDPACAALPGYWHHHTWRFGYALPSAVINALAVQQKDAPDDYEAFFGPVEKDYFPPYPQGYLPVPGAPLMVPQPFQIEALENGNQVVLTNVPDAVLRYTTVVDDTSKFSPLFMLTLSHLLASMLAGPIIKGDAGGAAAAQQLEMFNAIKGQAAASDANQRKTRVEPAVSWIRGR
jgi:hypothetical protein